jgi:hypothetical protein
VTPPVLTDHVLEKKRSLLVLLVLQKLQDELESWIFELFLFLFREINGQELARLDLHEPGSDHEKLPASVWIETAEDLNVGQELLGDAPDRDIEDIDLILLDEVQEEVQGAPVTLQAGSEFGLSAHKRGLRTHFDLACKDQRWRTTDF